MTKAELIAQVAAASGVAKRDVEKVLVGLAQEATTELAEGNAVTIPGVVKLTPKVREARTGRNPRTGETVDIPAKTAVLAKVSATLAKAVA